MGFFRTHAPKKSTVSINSEDADLTSLDPPHLLNIPVIQKERRDSYGSQISQMKVITEQNGYKFQQNASKNIPPTDTEFSVKNITLVSNGIKGEQERNMILEQQVRMLSQQAAIALDRLSDANKENEKLKDENNKLRKRSSDQFKTRFSFGRRQSSASSTASSASSTNTSVFSATNKGHYRSKNSSIMSVSTNIDQLKTSNDTFFHEIHDNYEKELNSLRTEAMASNEEIKQNKLEISQLQQQIDELQYQVQKLQKENKSLFHKLSIKKQKQDIEAEYYNNQLRLLSTQLAHKTTRTMALQERLCDFDVTCQSINNTRHILSL